MKKSKPVRRTHSRASVPVKKAARRRPAAPSRKQKKQRGPTPERLLQMGWGYAPPLILEAALNCGIFDVLDQGPQTIAELAVRTGTSARGLKAILDALVGLDLATRKAERYALTPESAAFLVSWKPGYHGAYFKQMSGQVIPNWLRLTEAVRSGQPVVPVNQAEKGQEFFAELVAGLFPLGYRAAQVLGEHLGVPRTTSSVSVLDLGAGSGVWGIALAHLSPLVTIRAVDWPAVLEVTRQTARH